MDNPGGPGNCPADSVLSLKAWNLMGGLDWKAMDTVTELLGIRDIEALIGDLVTIRDWQKERSRG